MFRSFVTDPLQAEKGAAFGLGDNYDQWGCQAGLIDKKQGALWS